MFDVTLTQVALFLAAAVVAAPLAKLLRIGNVLGYLLRRRADRAVRAGLRLLGLRGDLGAALRRVRRGAAAVPDRPRAAPQAAVGHARWRSSASAARRWRSPVPLLAAIAVMFGLAWPAALFAGLALSLSSTAFALQLLEEKGELGAAARATGLRRAAVPGHGGDPADRADAAVCRLRARRRPADGAAVGSAGHRHHRRRGGRRPLRARRRIPAGGAHAREGGDDGKRAADRGRRHAGDGEGGALRGAGRLHRRRAARRLRPTVTSSRPTSRPSRGCCWGYSSPPSACRST